MARPGVRRGALAAVLVLTACAPRDADRERHPEWVIRSQLIFVSQDLQTLRPLPLKAFRLLFPYIAGDLYGPPTTGDFIQRLIHANYTFEIDLNRTHADLLRSLQPTQFSLRYLKIDPPEARIARLAPLALQADGIEQIATADWLDPRLQRRLMLVYVDRPSRITGAATRNGHTTRYNIRIATAGYVWIGPRDSGVGEQTYTEVERPATVVLALSVRPSQSFAKCQVDSVASCQGMVAVSQRRDTVKCEARRPAPDDYVAAFEQHAARALLAACAPEQKHRR